MTYRYFKDLPRKTASDKVLRVKAFDMAKNPKCYGYQVGLTLMVYNIFDKKFSTHKGTGFKSENQQSVENLKIQLLESLKSLR